MLQNIKIMLTINNVILAIIAVALIVLLYLYKKAVKEKNEYRNQCEKFGLRIKDKKEEIRSNSIDMQAELNKNLGGVNNEKK